MYMGMIYQLARPGMKKTNHAQLTSEVFRVRRQILQGPAGASEQKLYPGLLIFPHPLTQGIGKCEGHQIPRHGQKQVLPVFLPDFNPSKCGLYFADQSHFEDLVNLRSFLTKIQYRNLVRFI